MPNRKHTAPSHLPRPTDSELALLRVLWRRGQSTVREVLEEINQERAKPLGYTTVLRFFQIMFEKGLVSRDERDRGHVYRAAVPAEKTKRQMVGDLIDRVFGGSARELVLQALGSQKVSAEELREIQTVIDQMGGKTK